MKLFVHSTTHDMMKYRVWTHLQALSHKGPQVRPIGIDSLQKTELRENMGKVTFIHGNVEASKQCTYVPLCLPYPTYTVAPYGAEVGACTVKTQCLHYSRVHPRSTIHRCAWPLYSTMVYIGSDTLRITDIGLSCVPTYLQFLLCPLPLSLPRTPSFVPKVEEGHL